MIKFRDLGTFKVAKLSPVIVSQAEVANNTFIVFDEITYLVCQESNSDDSYKEGLVFKAGEKIRGFNIKSLLGRVLVCDKKHIDFDDGETYASSITAGTTLLGITDDGELEIINSAPASGYYFKVLRKCRLTEDAVELQVLGKDFVPDCTLSALSLGSLTLNPTFASATTTYTTSTSNATNAITATATDSNATVAIKVNGTLITGTTCTWTADSSNTVVVTVTNGTESKAYTITVTHATSAG